MRLKFLIFIFIIIGCLLSSGCTSSNGGTNSQPMKSGLSSSDSIVGTWSLDPNTEGNYHTGALSNSGNRNTAIPATITFNSDGSGRCTINNNPTTFTWKITQSTPPYSIKVSGEDITHGINVDNGPEHIWVLGWGVYVKGSSVSSSSSSGTSSSSSSTSNSVNGCWKYIRENPSPVLRFDSDGTLHDFVNGREVTNGRWSKSSEGYDCELRNTDTGGTTYFTLTMDNANSMHDIVTMAPLSSTSCP